jgi:hypothetical protein
MLLVIGYLLLGAADRGGVLDFCGLPGVRNTLLVICY